MASIICENLSKHFWIPAAKSGQRREKKEVLNNLSFTIAEGERVGLIGLNGSGKTTLLRLIAGIYGPSSGKVSAKGKIFTVPNFSWANPRLKIIDNIYLGGALYGIRLKEVRKYIKVIGEFSGLGDSLNSYINQLSSGQLERINISASLFFCLSQKMDIILMDEPLNHSDASFINEAIRKLQNDIQKQITLVVTGHRLSILSNICDQAIWINEKKISGQGGFGAIAGSYTKFINQTQ